MLLKGGFETHDPRLDRIPSFDNRSLAYPIRATIEEKKLRSYTWSCYDYLDQGSEGACVGFSIGHEIAARPVAVKGMTATTASSIYLAARYVDEWPGEAYSGTSVLAGFKAATSLGYFVEYRWAFSLTDLALAVGYKGPAVLGINWYQGMFSPDSEGYLHVTGDIGGGHAILCNGVDVKKKRFRVHNSWGQDWGMGGDAFISFDDMERLLNESGDACVPVKRLRGKVSVQRPN